MIDLNERTITVGSKEEPAFTLMLGHVDNRKFVEAWQNESGGDGPSYDDDLDLKHTYGEVTFRDNGDLFGFNLDNRDPNKGAVKMTVMCW